MILKTDGFCYLLCLTELSGDDDEVSLAEITHMSEDRILLLEIYTRKVMLWRLP